MRIFVALPLALSFWPALVSSAPLEANETVLAKRQGYPDTADYGRGQFSVAGSSSAFLSVGGCDFYLMDYDSNVHVYTEYDGKQVFQWGDNDATYGDYNTGNCYAPNTCALQFTSSGNLILSRNNAVRINSNTAGRGEYVRFACLSSLHMDVLDGSKGYIFFTEKFNPPYCPKC